MRIEAHSENTDEIVKNVTGAKDREKSWEELSGRQKVRQIWDYYKLPIIIIAIAIYVFCYIGYRKLTDKTPVLYAALVNVAPDDKLVSRLSDEFLAAGDYDDRKEKVTLYANWYVTDDEESEHYEYVYATKMKILGSIDGELLDVVLMNREAFDAFSQNGYLADLRTFLPEETAELCSDRLISNVEILEDNAKDVQLGLTSEYYSVTDEYPMAVDVTHSPGLLDWDWSGELYLGFLKNTPRKEAAIEYFEYIEGRSGTP